MYFDVDPVDKAAVAGHVTLTSDPAVEGAWAWVRSDDGRWGLDYRTKGLLRAGTDRPGGSGCNLRPGTTGPAGITSNFSIGCTG